jgi:hypothetical protein
MPGRWRVIPSGRTRWAIRRVLVTEALKLLTPKAGKWPTVQTLVESLLADDDHDQTNFFTSGWPRACAICIGA